MILQIDIQFSISKGSLQKKNSKKSDIVTKVCVFDLVQLEDDKSVRELLI